MKNHKFITCVVLLLSVCGQVVAESKTEKIDFEEIDLLDESSGWSLLRQTEEQRVEIINISASNSKGAGDTRALSIIDSDEEEGSFGPGFRYELPSKPASIQFDFLLKDGREFPSVIIGNKREVILQIILSDGGESKGLAVNTASGMEDLEYEIELKKWYQIKVDLTDKVQVLLQPDGEDEVTFDLPSEGAELSAASYVDFLLAGSSDGVNGSMVIDNIVINFP